MREWSLDPRNIGGRDAWLCKLGAAPEALILMPGSTDTPGELAAVIPAVRRAVTAGSCRPFVLAAFSSDDWNRDYSPWPAPALSAKGEDFAGGGRATLAYLTDVFLPETAKLAEIAPKAADTMLAGYSLAGLFSLWAFYKTRSFGGCASCSGSLWYDGWADYQATGAAPAGSRVYLSLGDAEEKAKNPRMAAVGDATRLAAKRLGADPGVAATTLQMNPGGHFRDVPQRISAALLWLMAP